MRRIPLFIIIAVRLKAPEVRKTTDGGATPGAMPFTILKPWKGDRIRNRFNYNLLMALSSFQDFPFHRAITGGLHPRL